MRKQILFVASTLMFAAAAFAEVAVQDSRRFTDPGLGLTVASGSIVLPDGKGWTLAEPAADSGVSQAFLVLAPEEQKKAMGARVQKGEGQRQAEIERSQASSLFWICQQYARTNNGIGPATWADLQNTNRMRNVSAYMAPVMSNFCLVPNVPIDVAPARSAAPPRQPLALQLHPTLVDGKHWVLFNNGQTERVPVDLALCGRLGVIIAPLRPTDAPAPALQAGFSRHIVLARIQPAAPARPVSLTLTSRMSGDLLQVTWDLAQAAEGTRDVLKDWARARAMPWMMLAVEGDAPVLRYWLSRCSALYGADVPIFNREDRGRPGERTDAFSVLGGRAAVRETLQMQPLRQGRAAVTNSTGIPLEKLAVVDVKSHPFEEMLKSVPPGPALGLADRVPADRAFVYLPKPEALLPLLNEGGDFAFQGGSMMAGNSAAYDLKPRYLARLAMSEKWMRDLILKSGMVKEMAILAPDLFFIDGTELTVLARIPSAELLKPALAMLGVNGLTGEIQEKNSKAGKSYWAMDGDLLIIGTARSEVERVIALGKAGGAGSLGRSAEFRYMLTQMPLQAGTRAFCYLSDPFIRRLVGPEVKIGQLRRLLAKGEMEDVTAAAMLYRLDGQAGQPDIGTLVAKGYLATEPVMAAGCTLDDKGACYSPAYGAPGYLKTLLENPVAAVTPAEADAYNAYRDNYARFWRQYFDPIAFRLDEGKDGELELSTFILPLIDNTIYNGLKEIVLHKESGKPLSLPELTPKPLMLFSMNLSDESWSHITRELFSELLRRYTSLDPVIFDKIGPGVHLAVHDADPILTFGSGDALGLFGSSVFSGGRGEEMMAIPLIASLLTRPCQLMVELQEPDTVRRLMRSASSSSIRDGSRWDPVARFCQVEGRDAWICTISMEEVVNIRFGIEIQGNYLILNNLPWSKTSSVAGSRPAALNTLALDIHPEAGVLQAPGLFTAASDQERKATVQGERYLYPFLACGATSVVNAASQCRATFGFAPEHPGKGEWVWKDGQLRSTLYGSARYPVQPAYKPGDSFGILDGIDSLNLNLQFEDAGLRVVTRWTTVKARDQ